MKPTSKRSPGVVALLAWALAPGLAGAAVEREISITSEPSGAAVFLLQGRKETKVGVTPMVYRASFHSEKSILRLMLRRTGYDDKTLKIRASESSLHVDLAAMQYTAEPQEHEDPGLRVLQAKINPVVEDLLPSLLKSTGGFEYRLGGKVRMVKVAGREYISIPVLLEGLDGSLTTRGEERQLQLVKELWSHLGDELVRPLGAGLSPLGRTGGIKLDVYFDEKRFLFSVGTHVETRTDMRCVGGYVQRSVYDPCARQRVEHYTDPSGNTMSRNAGCVPGQTMQAVWDPCVRRQAVTKSELVLDPLAGVTGGKAVASFALDAAQVGQSVSLADLSFVLKDGAGEVLAARGELLQ